MKPSHKIRPLALILAAALLFTACTSSDGASVEEQLAALGATQTAGGGAAIFQFTRAQAATVPLATGLLSFNFYNNRTPADGDIVLSTQAAFAPTVTIQDIPLVAQSVVIRALTTTGSPLVELVAPIALSDRQAVQIDLSTATSTAVNFTGLTLGPDPLVINSGQAGATQLTLTGSFSDGNPIVFPQTSFATAATFGSNTGAVTVNPDGQATATGNSGSGTLTASYTVAGVTRQDNLAFTFSSLGVTPTNLPVDAGTNSARVVATFFNGNNPPVTVTEFPNTVYTISPPVTGFTANSNGNVTVDGGVASGTTATLLITHTVNGQNFTDTVTVTVN